MFYIKVINNLLFIFIFIFIIENTCYKIGSIYVIFSFYIKMSNIKNRSYLITSELISKWTELGMDNEVLNAQFTQIINEHVGKIFPVICDDAIKVKI
jgi:hypothetical protein